MKRGFDLAVSCAGIAASAPLLACVAILVWVCDGRPIFFRQERIGFRGRPFKIWKFRTMRTSAPTRTGSAIDDAGTRLITVAGDARVTRLGAWLRKTKLDELPQLFNVVAGEMSLVGPRPEVERYVRRYTEQQRRVLDLLPGITDAASICFRHESEMLAGLTDPEGHYVRWIVPAKIRLNLRYARRASVARDIGILFSTLAALFRRGYRSGDG